MRANGTRLNAGAGQASNAGQMPPGSSDEEDEDGAAHPDAPPQRVVVYGGAVCLCLTCSHSRCHLYPCRPEVRAVIYPSILVT